MCNLDSRNEYLKKKFWAILYSWFFFCGGGGRAKSLTRTHSHSQSYLFASLLLTYTSAGPTLRGLLTDLCTTFLNYSLFKSILLCNIVREYLHTQYNYASRCKMIMFFYTGEKIPSQLSRNKLRR